MTDEEYRQKAQEQYAKDGEIEIDDDADISREAEDAGDPQAADVNEAGAYVQAWVWVASKED